MFASLVLSPRKGAAALALGATLAVMGVLWGPPGVWAASAVLGFALAWASVVDIDRFILPDLITLGLVLAGLGIAIPQGPEALMHRVIGCIAGYAALVGVALYYRQVRKREGLGRGDAKLLAAAGAWLGWAALPVVLLAASLSALVWVACVALRKGRIDPAEPLPFGPFIALGFWIAWMSPDLLQADLFQSARNF